MQISITLHTTQNLGDHGREIVKSIGVAADTMIGDLVNKVLKENDNPNYNDHIEIRIIKELKL